MTKLLIMLLENLSLGSVVFLGCHHMIRLTNLERIKENHRKKIQYTPQPLYNTVARVPSRNHVSQTAVFFFFFIQTKIYRLLYIAE